MGIYTACDRAILISLFRYFYFGAVAFLACPLAPGYEITAPVSIDRDESSFDAGVLYGRV